MKLKCSICILRNGNAIKTDNLVLISINGRDYLACKHCRQEFTPKGDSHEERDNQPRSVS